MRTIQSFSYFNDKAINRDEMRRILAGDTLPEVTVSSSYTRVYGMNYSMWNQLQMLSGNFNSFNSAGSVAKSLNDEGGGGWGGYSTGSNFSNDANAFLSALSIGGGIHGITFDSIETFLKGSSNLQLVKNLSTHLGIFGAGLNFLEVLDHAQVNGWQSISPTDFATLVLGCATIVSIVFFAGSGGLLIGGIGIGFDMWKISQPQ